MQSLLYTYTHWGANNKISRLRGQILFENIPYLCGYRDT